MDTKTRKTEKVMVRYPVLTGLLAVGLVAGCSMMPSEAAQGGATPGSKSAHVVTINDATFNNCPAFAPEQAITVFDSPAWAEHVRVAVLQPNKLNTWQPDLSISTLVRYTLGSRPSAGYTVRIDGKITNERGVLTIPVKQTEPRKGMVTASVITSPCLYVQVSGSEYRSISIVDSASGKVLKKLAL
jgi:hypothetical protein